jgi:NTP pyrophosphatase (non-canonical NTP hydrolase)
MSDERFLQEGFDNQLAHVVEECGEVLAAAGKTQRFGAFSMNPLLPPSDPLYRETNIVWLKREMIDLQEAIARLQATIEEGDF